MENNGNKFDSFVMNSIIANNDFGIEKVEKLQSIISLYFSQELYKEVVGLIEKQDIESIKMVHDPIDKGTEFLEVMTFEDQKGKPFVVTVYDSLELWQDPQVINIFPC